MNRALWISVMLLAAPAPAVTASTTGAPMAGVPSATAPRAGSTAEAGSSPLQPAGSVRSSAPIVRMADASGSLQNAPKEVQAFMNRVLQRLPAAGGGVTDYQFNHWSVSGAPTDEAVGLLPVPGVQPEKLITRVMDVDHYIGNIGHVDASHSIANPAFKPPQQVEFYQRIDIPVVGKVQQDLVLVDAGTIKGYRVAYWYLLRDKTDKLDPGKGGARSAVNVGAWFVAPGYVGYALSSWPRRDDVGWFTWKALTTGADLTAKGVIEDNIKGMAAWAKK